MNTRHAYPLPCYHTPDMPDFHKGTMSEAPAQQHKYKNNCTQETGEKESELTESETEKERELQLRD